jgi:hypothetical protein
MDDTWKTKDGKELKISDMKTSYIENCIKMLERNAEKGIEIVEDYCYCGDDDFKIGYINGELYLNHTPYKSLKKELNKRNDKHRWQEV